MINRIGKDKVNNLIKIYIRRVPYLTRKWINILDSQTLTDIS